MIPKIVYPLAIDDDYTLFRTFNSSQTTLSKDISINDDIIPIVPRTANEADIWAENGFITIEDELIYYDKVGKNENGKIVEFRDCIRGVEGKQELHRVGVSVAANVVAQLHNQLVEVVIAIEDAIGEIGDMLKVGNELKQGIRKSLAKPKELAAVDMAFTSSLHHSLSSMLSLAPVGDDTCPDVEFEFNNLGATAEFCVRTFGNYTSFTIDFGDGITESNQLAGVHQYVVPGPYNPTVTVVAPNCYLVQSPTTPDEFSDGPTLPDPSVPFVVNIPDIPAFPQFVPQKQICPGPLLNLPPIIYPGANFSQISTSCPSVIISVIEACAIPQIISVISPCQISILSFTGCDIPSQIELTGCCPPSIISISAPTISVDWGIPPIVSVSIICPSNSCPSTTQGFAGPMVGFAGFDEQDIPLNVDVGIPEEIRLVVPHIPDIKLIHNIPQEIELKNNLPGEILIRSDIPRTIDIHSNIPSRIIVEPAPNFPSKVFMQVLGMRDTIEVVGIPRTIEIIENIPRTIQLLMPENPEIELKYSGGPFELKASAELEKMLSNLIVVPK